MNQKSASKMFVRETTQHGKVKVFTKAQVAAYNKKLATEKKA